MITSFTFSVLRAGAPPVSATYEAAAEIIQAAADKAEQHEIILQDGEYECKVTTILGIGATVKSCVKVTPTDDGGGMVVKVESSHEIILQDGEYECKVTTILGIGATVKSCVKVMPTDDGGGMVVKVESSYELIVPGPRVEQAQVQDENNNIAGTHEVGGASTSKVKMD